MSVVPRGMSVQEAYRMYREQLLLVNRKYQRKLVWTLAEKERFIDSVLAGYPIPLILLAGETGGEQEIVDGMQRFNALFSFIENKFAYKGQFFDVRENAGARQDSESGVFEAESDPQQLLSAKECATFLDYQLAVTVYPARVEAEIVEIFGRINGNGKHLSAQETRQAGIATPFADIVRRISAEIRGDASSELLVLNDMPAISIDMPRSRQQYGIAADETFWCKQGVLLNAQLRESEDEQMVADIAASILNREPLAVSKEKLDKLYSPSTDEYAQVNAQLATYGVQKLQREIQTCLSVLREAVEAYSGELNALRNVLRKKKRTGNPVKAAFYSTFMALFDLLVKEELSPAEPRAMIAALTGLDEKIKTSAHYTKTEDRVTNINLTKGLLRVHFVKKDPPILRHGPGLALDFENSVRRSRIESSRYEIKQGLLRLSQERTFDKELCERLVKTAVAIANVGPDAGGFIFLGVAETGADRDRIVELDAIVAVEIVGNYVVGIDREAKVLGIGLEQYVARIIQQFRGSAMSEPLRTQILSNFDTVLYRELSVIRITVPAQSKPSFIGDRMYVRQGSQSVEVVGPEIVAVSERFRTSG